MVNFDDDSGWASLELFTEKGESICVTGNQFLQIESDQFNGTLYGYLAKTLSDQLEDKYGDFSDHFYAAQMMKKGMGEASLARIITTTLNEYADQIIDSEKVKTIAQLNVPLYINFGYDDVLAKAIKVHSGRDVILMHSKGNNSRDQLQVPTVDNPVVFNIFGHLPVSEMESIPDPNGAYLAEDGLYKFLGRINETSTIPSMISKMIRDTDRYPLLFLGVGWQKWYVRMLISMFSDESTPKENSLALEEIPFFEEQNEDVRDLLLFSDNMRWKWDRLNHINTETRLSQLAKYKIREPQEVQISSRIKPGKNNRVFLSFRGPNLEQAQFYCKKLVENGFEVVADKRLRDQGGKQEIISHWLQNARESISSCFCYVGLLSEEYNDIRNIDGRANPARAELEAALNWREEGGIGGARQFIFFVGDADTRLAADEHNSRYRQICQQNVVNLDDEYELSRHIDLLVDEVNRW